ncbi:MAG: hypothetical protein NT069_19465 [Planctomycetota bacterium]|nr:hypothetical protein [Planctomycetota bacterium]
MQSTITPIRPVRLWVTILGFVSAMIAADFAKSLSLNPLLSWIAGFTTALLFGVVVTSTGRLRQAVIVLLMIALGSPLIFGWLYPHQLTICNDTGAEITDVDFEITSMVHDRSQKTQIPKMAPGQRITVRHNLTPWNYSIAYRGAGKWQQHREKTEYSFREPHYVVITEEGVRTGFMSSPQLRFYDHSND